MYGLNEVEGRLDHVTNFNKIYYKSIIILVTIIIIKVTRNIKSFTSVSNIHDQALHPGTALYSTAQLFVLEFYLMVLYSNPVPS